MKVSLGFKAHSGWAALVVVGKVLNDFVIVDRRRIELVEEEWAKQPYHAAENIEAKAARRIVESGIESAHQLAVREMHAVIERERARGNQIVACGVVVGNPMPAWSIEEILAVHLRMHQAEGVLFRDALVAAAKQCEIRTAEIAEKVLLKQVECALGISESQMVKKLGILGKSIGPPWGKDQKDAALAAMIAIQA